MAIIEATVGVVVDFVVVAVDIVFVANVIVLALFVVTDDIIFSSGQ